MEHSQLLFPVGWSTLSYSQVHTQHANYHMATSHYAAVPLAPYIALRGSYATLCNIHEANEQLMHIPPSQFHTESDFQKIDETVTDSNWDDQFLAVDVSPAAVRGSLSNGSPSPRPTLISSLSHLSVCNEKTPLLMKNDYRKYSSSSQGSIHSFSTDEPPVTPGRRKKIDLTVCLKYSKLAILCAIVIFALVALSLITEHNESWSNIAVKKGSPIYYNLSHRLEFWYPVLEIDAKSAFLPDEYQNYTDYYVSFSVIKRWSNGSVEHVQEPWIVPVIPSRISQTVGSLHVEHTFEFGQRKTFLSEDVLQLEISTNEEDPVSISVSISSYPALSVECIIMAFVVLISLYTLIIFEIVHRTLAAMIGATMAIAFLALLRDRPTLEKVISWLDVETLCLLFGMMVMVAILCETGFFDYTAVLAFRFAHGHVWRLITLLCLITSVVSAFLDNVTTILLMTPVAIRLCEVMGINPKPVLIAMVLFSNIGGTSTPIGDPPNVIIISRPKINQGGVNFLSFTAHVVPGALLCMIGCYILLRVLFRNKASLKFQEPPELVELNNEIQVWKKAAGSISGYSKDETTVRKILKRKVHALENLRRKKLYVTKPSDEDYKASLVELQSKYKIRNKALLVKTGVVMTGVILLFFMQSIPNLNLSLGWIAILGAILLLILADGSEVESILGRVEWSTLIFFAALFVVMEALAELDLLLYIGQLTQGWISSVDEDKRVVVAIILILWVSALASSFIDNIPFTTVMVKIVEDLSDNDDLDLPLIPLVYALAFGACLGGNGTLIGASANVVCAGVAEQHGYRFTFMDFFKVGFPVMLLTTGLSSVYLLACYALLGWDT